MNPTNPPAFPTSFNADYPHEMIGGLTMRDYFAARAMQAEYHLLERRDQFKGCAEAAYEMADAMLAAREAK